MLLPGSEDTIAAIATPTGRGALATVRVSGPAAVTIVRQIARAWVPVERHPAYVQLHEPLSAQPIDRGIITWFRAPRSYTGEDVVELSVHGGHLTPALVLAALLRQGARAALPGEFTRRAVVAGKLDLLQAEAVGDLIDAGSRAMHQVALRQLDGVLSREVLALRDAILALEALLAYDIDFPEEDEGPVQRDRVTVAADLVLSSLDRLLATSDTGEVVREGAVVVIAGPPNAGKSSLFNALVGANRAIVTDVPGTTRDAIESVVEIGRWPVRLVDTAGLRETNDMVERLGIEVGERYLSSAEVVLAVAETAESLADVSAVVESRTRGAIVPVRTKSDLERGECRRDDGVVHVSVLANTGLDELARVIDRTLDQRHGDWDADVPLLVRARHRDAIRHAREELGAFRTVWRDDALPAPVAAVHLRTAVGVLEEMLGVVDVEDVLDRVFRTFCVGK